MNQKTLKCYSWAVPPLLISVWLVAYAGVGNAAKKNMAISSNSATTAHAIIFHTERPALDPLHPFVSQTPDMKKAKEGATVVLGCQLHGFHDWSLNKLTVKWYRQDGKGEKEFMKNNVTALANFTRAFMLGSLSEGDASLTIFNVTGSDHGTYFCQVILPSGKAVKGGGIKLRIMRALGLFGIEESIGTIVGVVAAGIGGLVVLIVVLIPQLRKCHLCAKATSEQA